ncbi:MAG: carboxypeptidase-like regulatory domain-containing protein [Terracidiphilus sp.]
MTKFRLVLLAVLVVPMTLGLTFLPVLHAQSKSITASLSGAVTDPTGARVPKATVKLTDPDTGIIRSDTSSATGEFTFAFLPEGTYVLEASAPGFKTTRQGGIALAPGDTLTTEIRLTVGTTEEVTVNASGPLLQTQDSNISTDLTTQQLQELPLNLRNDLAFATLNSAVNTQGDRQLLAAGGSEDTADQDYSFLNFGGGYFGTNLFLLEGGYDVAQGWGGVQYVPAPEDTQQVNVTSYSFSAEYGFSTGNVINITTKSGTSDYHFLADEYLRNPDADANLYFNNLHGVPKTGDHRNQFGFAGGGPLYIPGIYKRRNKTFFFANYEGLRLNGGLSYSANVPTTAQEGGDFSSELTTTQIGTDALCRPIYQGAIYNPYSSRQVTATCATANNQVGQTVSIRDPYSGNFIPTSGVGAIDALANKLATGNYWPAPKNPGGGFNFNTATTAATTSNEWGIRIDHNINAKNRIYGQFSNKHEGKVQTGAFYGASDVAGPYVFDPNNRDFGVLGYSHVFSPTLILTSDLFFTRFAAGNVVQGYPFQPSSLGLPSQLDSWTPQFPQIQFGNTFSGSVVAPLGATQNSGEATFPENNASLTIDVNKSFKAHSLGIGYMGVWQTDDGGRLIPTVFNFSAAMTAGPDPLNPSVTTNGDPLASFMAGAANSGVGTGGSTGFNAFPAPTYYLHGMYVQDDWKANQKLTVNVGVRYEIQMPPTARHNEQAYFDLNALNPISAATGIPVYGETVYNQPGNRSLYNPNKHDLAPRLGFEWAGMPKLVMRGGYGVYYARNFYGGNGPDPGYSTSTAFTSSPDGTTVTTPFAQAFQSGLVPVTGSALKGLTSVGQTPSVLLRNRPDPLTQQFMYGFQYAFTPNDVLDVDYVGSRGRRITNSGGMNYGQLNPQYLSMGSGLNASAGTNPYAAPLASLGLTPMACPWTVAQSLSPYPEFCGSVSDEEPPIGTNNYNALQANFKHRFGQGLVFTASYTFSKFLSDVGGPEEWGSVNGDTGGSGVRNFYDLKADWSVDGEDIPQSLVLNYVYELPFGRGKKFGGNMNRAVDAAVGGWQVNGITSVQSGFPMSIGPNGNSSTVYGGNQHVNLTGAPFKSGSCGAGTAGNPSIPVGTKYCFFNPAAFTPPPAYTFGNGPRYYSNLRAPRYVDEDLTVAKWFNLAERFRLQVAVQMFNAFNHPNFGIPDSGAGDPTMGESSSTQGAREMQGVLKITY